MTSRTSMILLMLGLVLTAFGVGGIENSIADSELLASCVVSILGLLVMYCGVLALRVCEYYDERG